MGIAFHPLASGPCRVKNIHYTVIAYIPHWTVYKSKKCHKLGQIFNQQLWNSVVEISIIVLTRYMPSVSRMFSPNMSFMTFCCVEMRYVVSIRNGMKTPSSPKDAPRNRAWRFSLLVFLQNRKVAVHWLLNRSQTKVKHRLIFYKNEMLQSNWQAHKLMPKNIYL